MLEVILDLEIMLIKTFHWSLYELDGTDAVSVFDFLRRFGETEGAPEERKKKVFADQVSWL